MVSNARLRLKCRANPGVVRQATDFTHGFLQVRRDRPAAAQATAHEISSKEQDA
jgi:hypothetical protein